MDEVLGDVLGVDYAEIVPDAAAWTAPTIQGADPVVASHRIADPN